jgi:anti-sigma regulatory factor (Ser/Thr protein kinase)
MVFDETLTLEEALRRLDPEQCGLTEEQYFIASDYTVSGEQDFRFKELLATHVFKTLEGAIRELDIPTEEDFLKYEDVVHEAISNALKWGIKSHPDKCVTLKLQYNETGFLITVRDDGTGYEVTDFKKRLMAGSDGRDISTRTPDDRFYRMRGYGTRVHRDSPITVFHNDTGNDVYLTQSFIKS